MGQDDETDLKNEEYFQSISDRIIKFESCFYCLKENETKVLQLPRWKRLGYLCDLPDLKSVKKTYGISYELTERNVQIFAFVIPREDLNQFHQDIITKAREIYKVLQLPLRVTLRPGPFFDSRVDQDIILLIL